MTLFSLKPASRPWFAHAATCKMRRESTGAEREGERERERDGERETELDKGARGSARKDTHKGGVFL